MKNYSSLIQLNTTVDKVLNALTNEIPLWWTEMFEGSASKENDRFTVRFGESIYKTMIVRELSGNSKVVWQVTDSLIAVPGLEKQTEWINTTIIWEIAQREDKTELLLTHIGLHPDIECYNICIKGWQQFTDSLKLFIETGKGTPFKQ
ncbi:MAG TPA: SRPBCC domain-containing protein [Niabella sp.]|nr:SRPBCC domain-containing protein [Niabella sp.]